MNIMVIFLLSIQFIGICYLFFGMYIDEDGPFFKGIISIMFTSLPLYVWIFAIKVINNSVKSSTFIIMAVIIILGIIFTMLGNNFYENWMMLLGAIGILISFLFILINITISTINNTDEKINECIVQNFQNKEKFNNIIIDDETWLECNTITIDLNNKVEIQYDENTQKYYFEFNANGCSVSFNTYEDYFEIYEIDSETNIPIIKVYTVEVERFIGDEATRTTEYFYKLFIGEEIFKKFIKVESKESTKENIENIEKIERSYDRYKLKDFELVETIQLSKFYNGESMVHFEREYNYEDSCLYDCTVTTKDINNNDVTFKTSNYLMECSNLLFDNGDKEYIDFNPCIEVYIAELPIKIDGHTLSEKVLYYNINAKNLIFDDKE